MAFLNSIISWFMKKRIHEVELFMKYPIEVQQELLLKLTEQAKDTEFGKKYQYGEIKSVGEFTERVPISTYEDIYPYIERLMKGEQNILWPSEISWFAKSSGTTNARSKFIPVSPEALEETHFKGGKDLLSAYFNNHPDSEMFDGKQLTIGGSQQVNMLDKEGKTRYGDVSAVIIKNLPLWAKFVKTPPTEIALMENWEEKIEKMARVTMKANVTSISGVPTWTLVLLEKILEISGKTDIREIWPNLEVFFHGAVAFGPYREVFHKLIPSAKMNYFETYNASEGFFGIQDQSKSEDLLLMLDYGIFYEFIPMEEFGQEFPKTVQLQDVELNKNYAMVISTNAGLWRYQIGDTIRFTSLTPYRIRITGRTKHFINAFGEELIIENAETAIARACHVTASEVSNFTAAPVYMDEHSKGGHEWAIEFKKPPLKMDHFIDVLDKTLQEVNSDYEAKRSADLALEQPVVHAMPEGTFYSWLEKKGKLGGQNKVPRLSNSREFLEELLEMGDQRRLRVM